MRRAQRTSYDFLECDGCHDVIIAGQFTTQIRHPHTNQTLITHALCQGIVHDRLLREMLDFGLGRRAAARALRIDYRTVKRHLVKLGT